MTVNNGVHLTLARKGEIMAAQPERHSAVKRAAEQLSRRNIDTATCELFNEALGRVVVLAYERDSSGELCNVDSATGRLLIPAPWGRAGYKRWGMTPAESNIMRRIMLDRQRQGLPLFFYDRSRRACFLNLHDFDDGAVVLAQLKEWEITVQEYRRARSQVLGGRVGSD